jgi:hypothetical protein
MDRFGDVKREEVRPHTPKDTNKKKGATALDIST